MPEPWNSGSEVLNTPPEHIYTKEAFPKLQFLGKLPLKKRVSQPLGEKPQEVFQNQPGFGKTSKDSHRGLGDERQT